MLLVRNLHVPRADYLLVDNNDGDIRCAESKAREAQYH
jgi:hypothetical protein